MSTRKKDEQRYSVWGDLKIPLVWDGTNWEEVDYRKYDSVSEYKDAVEKTGLRFAICCAWPLDCFMKQNNLTFLEAFELMTHGYAKAAAKRGLKRVNPFFDMATGKCDNVVRFDSKVKKSGKDN